MDKLTANKLLFREGKRALAASSLHLLLYVCYPDLFLSSGSNRLSCQLPFFVSSYSLYLCRLLYVYAWLAAFQASVKASEENKKMRPNADIVVSAANGVQTLPTELADMIEVTMLGAGLEVGRSCCVIKFKGATVVCDAGLHPAHSGIPALPYVDELDWSTVDAILITHFHQDHAASLPYIYEKTNFKDGGGSVYMTHPTKDVYSFLMRDFVRMSIYAAANNTGVKLFDEAELEEAYKAIKGVAFYEEVFVPPRASPLETTIGSASTSSIKFTSYPAGHVLGAAMFLIEIAGARILYTGDFSTEEDRHLVPASVPNWGPPPDIMISEATFGVQTLEPREDKEARFTALVRAILTRGGRVLMPVFALGRAQELLLILDEYWAANPDLHQYPIYYVSALAAKCMRVYRAHASSLNQAVQQSAARGDNPFDFGRGRHIRELKDIGRRFDDKTPCVILASPGMLQNGISRQLLEKWAPDRKNGLILTGLSIEGTLARIMQHEPDDFQSMEGKKIVRRMSVEYISFAAHVEWALSILHILSDPCSYTQNARFVDDVKPATLILCHGEYNNCQRLRSALKKSHADRKQDIQIYAPANTETVKVKLARTRIARAIGTLANNNPTEGSELSGLLVAKDATYTLLAPADLQEFTGLSTTVIRQQQRIGLNVSWELVQWHLEAMYESIQSGVDENNVKTFRVMEAVDVKKTSPQYMTLDWIGSTKNDMIADSVLALLLGIDRSPATVKMTTVAHSHDHSNGTKIEDEEMKDAKISRLDRLIGLFDLHFEKVELLEPEEAYTAMQAEQNREEDQMELPNPAKPTAPVLRVSLDDKVAFIPVDTMDVQCSNEAMRKRVANITDLALVVATPLSVMVAPKKQPTLGQIENTKGVDESRMIES